MIRTCVSVLLLKAFGCWTNKLKMQRRMLLREKESGWSRGFYRSEGKVRAVFVIALELRALQKRRSVSRNESCWQMNRLQVSLRRPEATATSAVCLAELQDGGSASDDTRYAATWQLRVYQLLRYSILIFSAGKQRPVPTGSTTDPLRGVRPYACTLQAHHEQARLRSSAAACPYEPGHVIAATVIPQTRGPYYQDSDDRRLVTPAQSKDTTELCCLLKSLFHKQYAPDGVSSQPMQRWKLQ